MTWARIRPVVFVAAVALPASIALVMLRQHLIYGIASAAVLVFFPIHAKLLLKLGDYIFFERAVLTGR